MRDCSTTTEVVPCTLHAASQRPRQLGIRVDPGRPVCTLTDNEIGLLRELLMQHGAVCIVEQPLSASALHEFVARWGEVIVLTPGLALGRQEPGLPSITRIGNVRADGTVIPDVRFAEYWHHDGDFWGHGRNFVLNFLSSVTVPRSGGRTGLLDCRLAYARLPAARKASLAGAFICVRASEIADFKHAQPHEIPPDVRHPVLLAHPLTNEIALYLPDSKSGIQDAAGHSLGPVAALVRQLEQACGIVEHVWAVGDLLILDNLQLMHRSMGGYGDHPRLLYRCQARLQGLTQAALP